MEKKRLFSLGFVILIAITFTLGYYIGKNNGASSRKITEGRYEELTLNVNGNEINNKEALNKVIEKDVEIQFQVICNEGSKYIVERSITAEDAEVIGKKGIELEDKFKNIGYMLKDINNGKAEMIRKPIKYMPNRYVLSVENNEIIIAKSNHAGSIINKDGEIINKEGTGAKINSLRKQDIDNIIKGDVSIQFESIEKLNDGIKDFDIRYEMPE